MHNLYGKLFSRTVFENGGYKHIASTLGYTISKCYKSRDGHILSSYYEWLFDEYLSLNNIPHETECFIAPPSKCRCDFKIGNIYVEIWGISTAAGGRYNNYCERRKKKELLYKQNNLKLLSFEWQDFQLSSTKLQLLFKEKLSEFGIHSQDEQIDYPIFNSRKIGYWNDENIIKEISQLIKDFGNFPTAKFLLQIKRHDISAAIIKNGGYRKFAKILGYEPQTKKYTEEYLIGEIKNIKEKIGHFPCDRELQELKRSDIAGMIKSHGGYGYFKELLEGFRDKKPFGYWNNESNIINELKNLTITLGRFPRYTELGLIAKGVNKSKRSMDYFKHLVETK